MMLTWTTFPAIRHLPFNIITFLESGTVTVPDEKINTARELIDWATRLFEKNDLYFGHGTDNARDEAVFMVLRSLDYSFAVSDEKLDLVLDIEQKEKIINRIRERVSTRKPAAYILNEAWFAGLPFYINEQVLVPRSPIAELVIEKFSPWCDETNIRNILDVGTGSGCIAIATALEFPNARVDAIDISAEALAIAKINIACYGLQQRVKLIESDLFQNLADKKYDLIIANPPYVDAADMAALPAEYKHEPVTGLYAGENGLDVVKQILNHAANHLTEKGVIVIEVGNSKEALIRQYPKVPFLWLEFEHGGEGVFLFSREELIQWFP
jgi:ribosomal protein L3 glutamine methyltransferase